MTTKAEAPASGPGQDAYTWMEQPEPASGDRELFEIALDSRGRTSLARASRKYRRYEVEVHSDGTLILTPLIRVTPVELAMDQALQDPRVIAALDRSMDPSRTRHRRSWPGLNRVNE
jgi:hypothetical protein